jgi:hypothetical protein
MIPEIELVELGATDALADIRDEGIEYADRNATNLHDGMAYTRGYRFIVKFFLERGF